jgi:hypothetical protein
MKERERERVALSARSQLQYFHQPHRAGIRIHKTGEVGRY